jgi:DNA-binding IclR family transcriptional regulator
MYCMVVILHHDVNTYGGRDETSVGISVAPLEAQTKRSGVQVIARAALILRTLKQYKNGASLGEISQKIQLPRSTVQRIVNALVEENLVIGASSRGGYRLGPEIQMLAQFGQIDVATLVRPLLEQAALRTSETVNLSVFRRDKMVIVDQVIGSQKLRTVSHVGNTTMMATTSNGKAALAQLDPAIARQIITAEIGDDLSKIAQIEAELKRIRAGDLATNLDENADHICALGLGFKDHSGMICAISLPTPKHRFAKKRSKIADALYQTREELNLII